MWLMWKRSIFYLLFGCPMANLWPFSSGQRLSPNVNHFICQFSTWRLLGASLPCWVPKPSWIWTWYLSIQYQGLNPLGHSPHKGLFLSIMCNQLDSTTKELAKILWRVINFFIEPSWCYHCVTYPYEIPQHESIF